MPDIPDDIRLASDVTRFPNPAALTDSTGKVVGHITELFDHQEEGARRILLSWRDRDGAILSDEAGLGKSLTALAAIKTFGGKRNLIVVPTSGKKGLTEQWSGETAAELYNIKLLGVEDLSDGEGTYILAYNDLLVPDIDPETGKQRTVKVGKKTVKVTRLRPGLEAHFDTIVFDESHNMNGQGQRALAAKEVQQHAGKVLYMSATPFQSISDMHYLTRLGLFGDGPEEFARWAEKAGAQVKGNVVKNPPSHLPMVAICATLHVDGATIKRSISLEGQKNQFGMMERADLPEDSQRAFSLADELIHEASQVLPEGWLKAMYTGWAKQYWEIQKVPQAIEIAEKALAEGKQVAFFSEYKAANHEHLRAVVRQIYKRAERAGDTDPALAAMISLVGDTCQRIIDEMPSAGSAVHKLVDHFGGPTQVAEIHGDTKKKAPAEQRRYQDGKVRVVVATMAKGGTGISLHDTTGERPRVQINLSVPWSGRQYNQVAGRSYRLGSKSDAEQHWLVGDGDTERRLASVVAKRLRDMGALTAGDPEYTATSTQLLNFDFSTTGSDDDDAGDSVKAMEDALDAAESDDDAAGVEIEDQEARDYFMEFATARKAGRDVLQERYDAAQERKRKQDALESRRASEQLQQHLGWEVTHRPEQNAFEVRVGSVSISHNRAVYKAGGKANWYQRVFMIPAAGMRELAKKLGADGIKVDMNEVAKRDREETARQAQREAEAQQAAAEQGRSVTGQAPIQNPHRQAQLALGTKGIRAVEMEGGLFLTGNTYPYKDAIKRIVTGRGFQRHPTYGPGWRVREDQLDSVMGRIVGGDWKERLKLSIPFGQFGDLVKAGVHLAAWIGYNVLEKAEQLALFGDPMPGQTQHTAAAPKRPPGSGWQPIPGGKKGGFRRRKGTSWEYWYPDTARVQPHPHAHDEEAVRRARRAEEEERERAEEQRKKTDPNAWRDDMRAYETLSGDGYLRELMHRAQRNEWGSQNSLRVDQAVYGIQWSRETGRITGEAENAIKRMTGPQMSELVSKVMGEMRVPGDVPGILNRMFGEAEKPEKAEEVKPTGPRSPEGTIHLQAIGEYPAIRARNLRVGDVTVWNYGSKETISSFGKETDNFITVNIVDRNGKTWERRLKKDRLVGVEIGKEGTPEQPKPAPVEPVPTLAAPASVQPPKPIISQEEGGIPFTATKNDLPYQLAVAAHAGISHTPERRGEADQESYVEHMRAAWQSYGGKAKTPEAKKLVQEELEKYRRGYLSHLMAYLDARSRVVSPLVTGASKFPTRQNEKRNATTERRLNELLAWDKKALGAIDKKLKGLRVEQAGGPAAVMRREVEQLEKLQVAMRDANKIVRSKKLTDEEKARRIVAMGFQESTAVKIMTPPWPGAKPGFETWQFSNNLANIKRKKERIAELERREQAAQTQAEEGGPKEAKSGEGWSMEEDAQDNRLRLYFDGKPTATQRTALKREGWRWSPRNGAWQRQLTQGARLSADRILREHFGKAVRAAPFSMNLSGARNGSRP